MTTDLTIPGARWRQTYQHSVNAILGSAAPPVHSAGRAFRNIDRWTTRKLIEELCTWAGKHPNKPLTLDAITSIVEKVNSAPSVQRLIQIASTPEQMPIRTALALTGGAYHEAFHTKYSRTRNLRPEAVLDLVLPRWPKVKNWSKYLTFMLDFSNFVEDIRIERLGIQEYPGVSVKLHDLQDFVLNMEEKGEVAKPSSLSIICRTFRDVGLGYVTATQRRAIERYRLLNQEAFDFVLKGPLTPALREAISLTEKDDMGCLRITMDVVAIFDQEPSSPPPPPPSDGGEEPDEKKGQENPDESEKGKDAREEGNEGEEEDNTGVGGDGPDSSTEKGDPQAGGDGAGEPSAEASEAPEDSPPGQESTSRQGGKEAGSDTPPDWDSFLSSLKDQANDPQGLLDKTRALEEAIRELTKQDPLEGGESPYSPATTDFDEIAYLTKPPEGSKDKAKVLLTSVREETGFLRSRLRTLVRALECVGTLHGVQHGQRLSEPFLVDTWTAIQAGQIPHRAFSNKEEVIETSFAAAVCIDESESMKGRNQVWATKIAFAITDALDTLGCPVMVSGFRVRKALDATKVSTLHTDGPCHRVGHAITHDVFKKFDEKFGPNQWKFTCVRATGGTPMADGLQFSLRALEQRPEANRILFVITDGDPDPSHKPVIKHQLRLAKEAGIHIVGVGLGEQALYVTKLFPEHVWSNKFSDLPKGVVGKLNRLVDILGSKRGRTLRKTK